MKKPPEALWAEEPNELAPLSDAPPGEDLEPTRSTDDLVHVVTELVITSSTLHFGILTHSYSLLRDAS